MKTFKVYMDQWDRGNGTLNGRLINPSTGMKCCLGFVGEQCGFSRENLIYPTPMSTLFDEAGKWPAGMIDIENHNTDNSSICYSLMETNDDSSTDDEIKMSELNRLAAKLNFQFEFIEGSEPK